MINHLNSFCVGTNGVCDYMPVVSTLKSLFELFQKCVVLPFINRQSIAGSHYYTSLEKKSVFRCVVLLIPVIGNIFVGIYDWKRSDKGFMLAVVQRNGQAVKWASEALKGDKEIALAAVKQNGQAFWHLSYELKNSSELIRLAIEELEKREKKDYNALNDLHALRLLACSLRAVI